MLSLGFCTSNLHHLLCMLTVQAEARGDTRHYLELFVERGIQHLKRRTKFRSTSKPESVIANGLELSSKLHDLQQQSTTPLLSLADLLSGRASSSSSSSGSDASGSGSGSSNSDSKARADEDGSFLLDAGVVLQGGDAEFVIERVRKEFCSGSEVGLWGGWTDDMLRNEFVIVYEHLRVSLADEELVTSRKYTRAKVRDSTHVLVPYEMIGGEEQWVGQVDRFVRLEFVGEGGGEAVRPLRIALVDFFEYCAPMCDKDWGVVHKVVLGADGLPLVIDHSFPVQICRIRGKLIYADGVVRVGPHVGKRVRYFASYNHLSGLL